MNLISQFSIDTVLPVIQKAKKEFRNLQSWSIRLISEIQNPQREQFIQKIEIIHKIGQNLTSIAELALETHHQNLTDLRRLQSKYEQKRKNQQEQIKKSDRLSQKLDQSEYKIEMIKGELFALQSQKKQLQNENESLRREISTMKNQKILQAQNTRNTQRRMSIQIRKQTQQNNTQQLNQLYKVLKEKNEQNTYLQLKIREIDSLHQIEKNASSKLRQINQQLKISTEKLNSKNIQLKNQILINQQLIKQKQSELLYQKSHHQSMVKQLNFQLAKRSSFATSAQQLSPNLLKKTMENLGDFLQQIQEQPQSDSVFLLQSPTSKFKLFDLNPLILTYQDQVSIIPPLVKKSMVFQTNEEIFIFPQIQIERNFLPFKLHTQHIDGFLIEGKKKVSLSVDMQMSVKVFSENYEKFSDPGSVGSDDPNVPDPLEIRDPIMDYFVLTCQAAKLTSPFKDIIGKTPVKKLYERVLVDGIPFYKWHSYVQNYLHQRIRRK